MSYMKDLDYRVMKFGEMLFDEKIEEYETQAIEMGRGEDVYGHSNPDLMVELLQDMKKEWTEKRVMTTCLASAFKEWMKGDEATVLHVLESDIVDFEVIGYMAIWVELYIGGREDEI